MTRHSGRADTQMRAMTLTPWVNKFAEGSCLVKCGDTEVLCTASVEHKIPAWMKQQGKRGGWITAEYGMLPRANIQRIDREAIKGKQDGRSQEIQRLIGRSMRAAVDLHQMDNLTIKIDCDVLQADGGTRTACINGAYVALVQAIHSLMASGKLEKSPLLGQVAAISCGIVQGVPVVDLDFVEDSNAGTDINFVMNDKGELLEVQGTAEGAPFTAEQLTTMMKMAQNVMQLIFMKQKEALTKPR
ncbi:MAG: ribonuclease PH [Alphaproteobacteria bacterium]